MSNELKPVVKPTKVERITVEKVTFSKELAKPIPTEHWYPYVEEKDTTETKYQVLIEHTVTRGYVGLLRYASFTWVANAPQCEIKFVVNRDIKFTDKSVSMDGTTAEWDRRNRPIKIPALRKVGVYFRSKDGSSVTALALLDIDEEVM